MKKLIPLIMLLAGMCGSAQAGGLFPGTAGVSNAEDVIFSPGSSGMSSTDVDAAIKELNTGLAAVTTTMGISDTAYDATSWNGVTTSAPSKNAVRDKIETLQPADADLTTWAGVTPGTGVGTALANAPNASGGFLVYGNAAVLASPLTGFSSGAGTVAATDTILQAFNKIVGNAGSYLTAEVDGSTTNEIEVVDETYNATNFNGGTASAVSQDDFYDYCHTFDTDDDGALSDESWLTGTYAPLVSPSFTTPTLGAALATSLQFSDGDASPGTVGVFRYDNTISGLDDGGFVWYDDDEIQTVCSIDSSASFGSGQDGYQVTYHYNSGNGYFDLQTAGSGSLASTDIDTSSELYTILTNETGTGGGTPLAVFNYNPTLTGLILAGDVTQTGGAYDWDLVDNNASALSWDSTGKAGILEIVTTDSAEGVKMSGTLTVTGAITAASITTSATSAPAVTLSDSDNAAGTGSIVANSSGGTNDIILTIGVEDSTGEGTSYVELDGVAEDVEIKKPLVCESSASVATALTPDTAGGATFGSTSLEWGNAYFHDGVVIYGQADQSATLTSSASLWTANNFAITTQFKLPSSDADPTGTAGYIRHDSSNTSASGGGLLAWHDGTNIRQVVDTGTTFTQITRSEYIPIRYGEDDDSVTAPAAAAEISTSTMIGRAFDATADEGLVFWWQVPLDYVSGIKYRVYYSPAVTTSTTNETAAFSLAGASVGNSDAIAASEGTAVVVSDELTQTTDAAGDIMVTDWSTAVTVTNITAGEMAKLLFIRDVSEDDYTDGDLIVTGIEIKYVGKINAFSDY